MPMKFTKQAGETEMVTLAQRTYLDADGKATAGRGAVTLLGVEGKRISKSAAVAAGIPTGELTKAKAPAKNKAKAPAKNKAR